MLPMDALRRWALSWSETEYPQRTAIDEIRESSSRCQSDIVKMTECLALVQVGAQRVAQKISDLEETYLPQWCRIGPGLAGLSDKDCPTQASNGRADQRRGARTCSWDRSGPGATSLPASDARKEAPRRRKADASLARRNYSSDANAE